MWETVAHVPFVPGANRILADFIMIGGEDGVTEHI